MIESFIDFLEYEKRYSRHTLVAYRKDVESFEQFSAVSDWKSVSFKDVRGWMLDMLESGMKSVTVNRKLSSLRTFFDWLIQLGEIEKNPMKLITGLKKEKRLPVFVKQSSLSLEVMNSTYANDFEGYSQKLMIEVFYQTGIRLSELIHLRWSDLTVDQLKVKGKGNKDRLIPISNVLAVELLAWKAMKGAEGFANSDHIFSLKNGKKLYPSLVYRRINDYLSKVTDLSKRSPHVLRHTFATHLLNNGAGLEVIKELLGHASLAATQVYTHNSFAELTKIYSQAHPRGHKN